MIITLDISPDQLDILASKIAERIHNKPTEPARAAESTVNYLSRVEAAQHLHITLATLSAWTKSGKLKAYRIGRRVLYKASEIESALSPIRLK